MTTENTRSYLEGLAAELVGAEQHGDKDHERAIRAEIARLSADGHAPVERAVNRAPRETRKVK